MEKAGVGLRAIEIWESAGKSMSCSGWHDRFAIRLTLGRWNSYPGNVVLPDRNWPKLSFLDTGVHRPFPPKLGHYQMGGTTSKQPKQEKCDVLYQ
jgi:hypothetical protein